MTSDASAETPPARLVTIGISHFCEKARWALEWTGTPFVEEAHAPALHIVPTRRAGGRSAPTLKLEGQTLCDSTDILVALDARARERGRPSLYPDDAALRREAEALEDTFDEELGPATRRLVYHLILPHRTIALALLGALAPRGERFALAAGFPAIRALMRKGMRIDDKGAARARETIVRVLAAVGERLKDGRAYLVGDRFGAADLTFAALAAPVLLPPGYGAPVPGMEELPPELRELVTRMRETRAGAFALETYRRHRACV